MRTKEKRKGMLLEFHHSGISTKRSCATLPLTHPAPVAALEESERTHRPGNRVLSRLSEQKGMAPKARTIPKPKVSLDETQVAAAYATLNLRPRKHLGWKCSEEVFHSKALHLL